MGMREDFGNFDLGRLTIVGWLVFLLSPVVGGIVTWQVHMFMLSQGVDLTPDPNKPASTKKYSVEGFIMLGATIAFFFAAKLAFNAIGVTMVKPKKEDAKADPAKATTTRPKR